MTYLEALDLCGKPAPGTALVYDLCWRCGEMIKVNSIEKPNWCQECAPRRVPAGRGVIDEDAGSYRTNAVRELEDG